MVRAALYEYVLYVTADAFSKRFLGHFFEVSAYPIVLDERFIRF